MPTTYPASEDAIAETGFAYRPQVLWRPNHLLLTPTYRLCVSLFGSLFEEDHRFLLLQFVNAIFGSAAAALVHCVLANLGVRRVLGLLASLLVGLSYAHWLHSREGESAIISQFFLMASICTLSFRLRFENDHLSTATVSLGATFFALSVLFSMNNVVLLPAVCLFALAAVPRNQRVRSIVLLTLQSGLLVLAVYGAAATAAMGRVGPGEMARWVLHHPSEGRLAGTKELTLTNLFRAGSGLVNAFVGYSGVPTAAKQLMRGKSTDAIPAGDWIRFLTGSLLALFLALGLLARPHTPNHRGVLRAAVAAVLCVGLFNILWLGSDPQFWLPALPLMVILAAQVSSGRLQRESQRKRVPFVWVLGVLVLVASNFSYPVPTLAWPYGGKDYDRAGEYTRHATSRDLLLHAGSWGRYVPAFGTFRTLSMNYSFRQTGASYLAELSDRIDETLGNGGNVYAVDVVRASPVSIGEWDEIQAQFHVSRHDAVQFLSDRFALEPVQSDTFGESLWRIRKKED